MKNKRNLKPCIFLLSLCLLLSFVSAAPVEVIRDLAYSASAGDIVNVKLNVVVSEKLDGVIIAEHIPVGWSITSTNTPIDEIVDNEFKWLIYGSGIKNQTIEYTIGIPSDEAIGGKIFYGNVLYIPAENNTHYNDTILGDTMLDIIVPTTTTTTTTTTTSTTTTTLPIPGDLDGDLDVDHDDYLIFRSAYRSCIGDNNFILGADFDRDGCVIINDCKIFRRLVTK